MMAISLKSLKEKQMEDYKYVKLRCVHLRDRLGSRAEHRLGRTSQITFHSNRLKHDRCLYQSRMLRAPIFLCSHFSSFAPLCYILMDSVRNPCGTDYIVEGSGFDRLQISTTARQQQLPK